MNAPVTSAPAGDLVQRHHERSAGAPQPLLGVRRPAPSLMRYYLLQAIATGPGVIVMLPLRWFRYHTLRYTFDDEGVTVRWGILFRREISLTYARIQDIHLVSNVIERWFGLGRVQVQTASGQAGAEMTIEGLPDFEAVRDALYRRMRGARGQGPSTMVIPEAAADAPARPAALATGASPEALDEAAAALRAAVAELRAIRALLEEERR
jgi:putative membrane protein